MSEIKPFHLSFSVPDLKQSVAFYTEVLGCEIGRYSAEWVDIIFFGNQLTLHQNRDGGLSKPIDHFGPILTKAEWKYTASILSLREMTFLMSPTIYAEGTDAESGKYLVNDPAGNILEFKYYANFAVSVAGTSTHKQSQ